MKIKMQVSSFDRQLIIPFPQNCNKYLPIRFKFFALTNIKPKTSELIVKTPGLNLSTVKTHCTIRHKKLRRIRHPNFRYCTFVKLKLKSNSTVHCNENNRRSTPARAKRYCFGVYKNI